MNVRTSSICIAVATTVASVGISTAFFFTAWRMVIDAHQYFFGIPMSPLGVWALIFVDLLFVLPACVVAFAACIDRCPALWLGFLTFFCSILATAAFIASPALRHFLPIGFIAEGTNSSERWYCGALLQLALGLWLLKYFRTSRTLDGKNSTSQ
jgi:hypothetical protein